MSEYIFNLLQQAASAPDTIAEQLAQRPCATFADGFAEAAPRFVTTPELEAAINAAVALGRPLLLSGEAGCGKTQVAYYVAWRLQLEPVLHFQTRSDSCGKDLLYHFDAARYFRDAQLKAGDGAINKAAYIEPRALWQAMAGKSPRVVLIDEVDNAPRDFVGDLLHELDKLEFTIPEIGKSYRTPPARRPLVFITANGERRLPDAFLRRCVQHRIRFSAEQLSQWLDAHEAGFSHLSPGFVQLALERFLALREKDLRKKPSPAEWLDWLRVLDAAKGTYPERLDMSLGKLPYLGVLLKDPLDLQSVTN